MSPISHDLTIEKRATFARRWYWSDKNKRPIDLTGYAATLQVRSAPNDPTVLLELSTANGGITLGNKGGSIILFLNSADTTAITWTSGVYDLLLTAPNGDKIRLVEGSIVATEGVTQ